MKATAAALNRRGAGLLATGRFGGNVSLHTGITRATGLFKTPTGIGKYSQGSLHGPATVRFYRQATPSSSILEVERKFAPTPLSIHLLADNKGETPFTSITHQGDTEFEDIYYDTKEEHLCNAGIWLRRRGDQWEAKVRVGGDFTNSAFEEITDVDNISSLLNRHVPGTKLDAIRGPQGGELEAVARFVSHRKKFLVDYKFTVILDTTNFGHVVGEVELERYVEDVGRDLDKASMIAEMDREIDDFMKRYVWAFPSGKPVGKLSAYFALKASR